MTDRIDRLTLESRIVDVLVFYHPACLDERGATSRNTIVVRSQESTLSRHTTTNPRNDGIAARSPLPRLPHR
ncbi:hypothetical protein [Halorarum salinum]|uniref:Uncharacterized protein n=1 Tax=Halorarum salinum TaxID=2743089 RepID=A0A7D5QB10_9EURY|nr:hypothetical protein [Halobaculum salinum]QLG61879.1 hypothetical protein HUG12_09145 [Halobaculum salinum]